MTYLYLLPFKDGIHFKLGISISLDSRVKTHYSTYDLDLDKALFVTANKSAFILSLEQELLLLLEDPKYLIKSDGHTEIRFLKDFEKAVQYIKDKNEVLGFKIEKYDGSKFKRQPDKNNVVIDKKRIKFVRKLARLRKELGLTELDAAKWFGITQDEYSEIEKTGCDDAMKRRIITFLMAECSNPEKVKHSSFIKYELEGVLIEMPKVKYVK